MAAHRDFNAARALVDLVVCTKLMVDSIGAWFLKQRTSLPALDGDTIPLPA
jgi:hypothetical protein